MEIKSYRKGQFARLSDNFAAAEFACHGAGCCDTVWVDQRLVGYLQQIRDHFGVPVHINSGYRCVSHNAAVGGATGSYHVKGMAADIRVEGVAPEDVARYAESIGVLGIGLYADFVHIDTRAVKSFWYGHGEEYRDTFATGYQLTVPVMRKGSRGGCVKALQQLLMGKGYSCGVSGADGDFGMATDGAVRLYQKQHSLDCDGCVGQQTMASLLGLE